VDQGRLVAVRARELRRCGSSFDGLLQDTVGTAASASWGSAAHKSIKSIFAAKLDLLEYPEGMIA
jgi:hypothetical protein